MKQASPFSASMSKMEELFFFFTNEAFVEGVTETTARIQVWSWGRCVLLDSPGLHSVTDANEAVTRSYTDSADAVLWLTRLLLRDKCKNFLI